MKRHPYDPVEFVRQSLGYLAGTGTPKWQLWLVLPLAYGRFVFYTWRHRQRDRARRRDYRS